jgi:hypothetical protein
MKFWDGVVVSFSKLWNQFTDLQILIFQICQAMFVLASRAKVRSYSRRQYPSEVEWLSSKVFDFAYEAEGNKLWFSDQKVN